ncbi:hypothetical protein Pla123a_00940 [Posidoniimonas polymericola]|uniref:Uncharacterized protein n=1 Tax=Posidoniimonas polymericola TaxID=2528002 RepID=A0A5C5ZDY5_9BACT|nr:hypothetical protein [Posidoniimonas polymericola]TWT85287.1 hypothetical protein Pla123a_00940 [Posidoniimonas polymericola]
MSEKKPLPLDISVKPKPSVCPVCGHSSYSRAGIHPQCVGVQVDKKHRTQQALEAKAAVNQDDGDAPSTPSPSSPTAESN